LAKVDVVVPCYNYGRFLAACVRSVLEQSVSDVRVLIIDDASSDDTLVVATRRAAEDRRVSIIAHTTNLGHIRTYNQGIAWASADYFLLLSADDFLLEGALARAVAIMDKNPDIVMTHGHCILWEDGSDPPDTAVPGRYAWERHDLLKRFCQRGDIDVYDATAIARTSVQKQIGGYLESLPHCADLEMWLRFAQQGAVAYIAAPQAVYRKHPSAMTNSYCFTAAGCRQRQEAFDSFFQRHTGARADWRALRKQAQRNVARLTFRDGCDHLRRGRFNIGLQLVRLAVRQEPWLLLAPPLGQLFRLPGPEGRRWAASVARRAGMRLVGGI
jgi:GT2 family glycosyltransferase